MIMNELIANLNAAINGNKTCRDCHFLRAGRCRALPPTTSVSSDHLVEMKHTRYPERGYKNEDPCGLFLDKTS